MAVAPKAIRAEPLPMAVAGEAARRLVGRAADRRAGADGLRHLRAWAALQNANYYAAPYLSPFYSPCLAANCAHVTLPLIGSWWNLSPALPDPLDPARLPG